MTNKDRFKKAVCVVLAAFGVLYLANSCRPVESHAYDLPTGTTHISSDTLVQWLGSTLPAQYVGTDLQYHATTARRISSTEYIVSSDMDGYTSNLYNGRSMAWYVVDLPTADTFTAFPYAPIVTIDFNLHLENVTYCDFGFADYVSNKYQNVSYNTVQPYCYLDYNYQGQYNKLYNPAAAGTYSGHLGTFGTRLSSQYNTHYGGGIIQLSGSASDLYVGTVSACCLGNFDGGLIVGICLLDIIVNDDYILSSSAPPPQGGNSGGGDTPSGSTSGSLSGTIGDSPVDIIVEVEQDYPDYFYSGGDAPVYDDEGYSQELAPVIDDADNAYEVVEDGLEVLSEMPMLPSWNYLDSILSLVPAFKALMIAAFILTLYGWKIYR